MPRRPAEIVSGVVVGSDGRWAWTTREDVGNPHVLLIGPTRSGKTRRVILPTVWALGHRGESMVLTDPKGELYEMAHGWLRRRGYRVVLLDLLNPERGDQWNPLEAVHRAWTDETLEPVKRGESASRQAWGIGEILAWAYGAGQDPIWPQAEESLISALCLLVAMEAGNDRQRHMASVYRILTELGPPVKDVRPLDTVFDRLPINHLARRAFGTTRLSEARTRSSIYTGTAAHLRLWGEPGVTWLCARSTHDPVSTGEEPTAVFLVMPDQARARREIACLYIAQLYNTLAEAAMRRGGRLARSVWFLLDEFGNVGKLPDLKGMVTTGAGYGIRFLLVVQSLAQIDEIYGHNVRQIVTGNCHTWLFLGTSDVETAKVISAQCGTYTVRTHSVQQRPDLYLSRTISGTEAATARPLLTVDEVLRWPQGESLVLQAGEYPVRLPIVDLSAWPAASRALRSEPSEPPPPLQAVPSWVPRVPTAANEPKVDGGSPGRAPAEARKAGATQLRLLKPQDRTAGSSETGSDGRNRPRNENQGDE